MIQNINTEESNARYEKVADWLLETDYLVIATGAGFGKDAGLPVYKDVCDDEIYRDKHKVTYQDLSKPSCLIEQPRLFYGFWTNCLEKYRATEPHQGYDILEKWVSGGLPKIKRDNFYVYTSNVDGHFRRFPTLSKSLMEVHGCAEDWMCSRFLNLKRERAGDYDIDAPRRDWESAIGSLMKRNDSSHVFGQWEKMYSAKEDPKLECMMSYETAPANFFASVNEDNEFTGNVARPNVKSEESTADINASSSGSNLNFMPRTPSSNFASSCSDNNCGLEWPTGSNVGELPKCKACNELARPAVVLFDDSDASLIDRVFQNGAVYQRWEIEMEKAVLDEGKKVTILEIGCGTMVPSVRQECEQICQDLSDRLINEGKNCSDYLRFVRINPDQTAKNNEIFSVDHIPENALDVLKLIDASLSQKLAKRTGLTALRGGFPNVVLT